MPTVTTNDGAGLYYEDHGSGRPLVFVNGWCMTTRFWQGQVDDLASEFRCITYDPRDFGQSEKVQRGRRMARYARDLYDLMVALDASDAVVVGWSTGGAIALCYADLFAGERLAGMVVVDQSPCNRSQPGWPWGFGTAEQCEEFIRLAAADLPAVGADLIRDMFAEPPPAEVAEWMLAEVLKTPPDTASEIERDDFQQDWRDVLPQIAVPTLVVTGAHSKIFPSEAIRYLAGQIPGARLEVFPNSGHVPFIEERDRFNEVLRGFVRGL
jgi:pimeloyl-ACP methyl ester carboxylesterase